MDRHRLIRAVAGALALGLAAGSAHAAPAKDTSPAGEVARAASLRVGDRMVDPAAIATRQALLDAIEAGVFSDKATAVAIIRYYGAQGLMPTWTAGGMLTPAAVAIIARIAAAGEDGLDAAAFKLPPATLGASAPADAATLAAADVMLSQAIVSYARQAWGGRVNPSSVSDNFGYEIVLPEPAKILAAVAGAADPAAAVAAFNPPQPEFAALKAKLAELRNAKAEEAKPDIPAGDLLKPGMSDARVPMIRERLGVAAGETPDLYDEAVVAAVKDFQKSARLSADGIVGNATIAAFNRGPVDPVPLILANMERWRWMPRDLGDFYVRVNVPDFNLDIYRDRKVVHTTRVVVGKVTNQTPIFSDEIEHIVVNPVWNVPASIAVKEMLPAIRARRGNIGGYEVYANIGGRFRLVDPRSINWNTVDMRKIQIKQPPGERNALGSIKFMFPNSYAVYLHDTPSKSLFRNDYRAYSHGCVRVMDPWDFADALLIAAEGWGAARLKKLVGGPERRVDMPKHIPVHITYFTAWVDDTGALQVRDDVYGHDKRTEKALGLI